MKILIVDDESRKLGYVKKLIRNVEGIDEGDLSHALDLSAARKLIQVELYDLLILDLKIPDLLGEANDNHFAGLDFLDELIETEMLIKPKDIVLLTEFEELVEESVKRKRDIFFPILKYSETSVEWQSVIKSKIKYGLVYGDNKKVIEGYSYDVAIITAVPNETRSILTISDNWKPVLIPKDPTLYKESIICKEGKNIRIVTAQQSEMGIAAASTLTCKLIDNFRPRYLIMSGIAAGIGDDKNYGDIIVAKEVWNYSSGKYVSSEADDMLVSFLPDPKSISLDPMVVKMLERLWRAVV